MKALTNERKTRNSVQTLPIHYPRQRWVRIQLKGTELGKAQLNTLDNFNVICTQ